MANKLPETITIKQPLQEAVHAAEAAGRSLVTFPEEAARGVSTGGGIRLVPPVRIYSHGMKG